MRQGSPRRTSGCLVVDVDPTTHGHLFGADDARTAPQDRPSCSPVLGGMRRPPVWVARRRAVRMRRIAHALVAAVCGLALGCTYAPAEPLVRVANHAARAGTDSVAIAVYAAEMRRPTGIAAFPDGGAALLQHEQGIFYLCVASPERPASIARIAVLRRPDSLRTGFTPWVSGWDSPASVIVSLRGYASAESRTEAHRILWYRLRLPVGVEPRASGPGALEPATSLQALCEAAVVADARVVLARTLSTPDAAANGERRMTLFPPRARRSRHPPGGTS